MQEVPSKTLLNAEEMKRVFLILAGMLILVLSGCSDYTIPAPECPDGTTGLSYKNDIQPIFNSNCITCHSGNQSPDLSEGWSYEELIEGGYVVIPPDNPCDSKIYQVFSSTHSGRASDEEVLDILGWIQDGAQDN
jgi:hypothetical protein